MWNNFPFVICCLHAVFARFKTKIYSKNFPYLSNNSRKTGNIRTGTEIEIPCIAWKSPYSISIRENTEQLKSVCSDNFFKVHLMFSWSNGWTNVRRYCSWCEKYEQLSLYKFVSPWCRGKVISVFISKITGTVLVLRSHVPTGCMMLTIMLAIWNTH